MTRPALVFIASHLGYPMDETPLGGGAMVGLHLARRWAQDKTIRLAAIGSGKVAPFADNAHAVYARVRGSDNEDGIVHLGELAYARFCREFERQTTQWLLARKKDYPPSSTVVVVNDISEGPDLALLRIEGYRIVSIWHVDVVDYFARIYLRGFAAPETLVGVYEGLRLRRLAGALPDVLKLVFEKQHAAVHWPDLLVLPSSEMRNTIERCYGRYFQPRFLIQPWGAVGPWRAADPKNTQALREKLGVGAGPVVMTLSRISPEKGIDRLIEAMGRAKLPAGTTLLVCGEPAFMMGRSYMKKVKAAAKRLTSAKVAFAGYVPTDAKPEHFALADLFVSPSVHESYGLTIVEALRAGLPVLATDHYGVRDILKDDYGMRTNDLSAGLEALLGDPKKLKAMGAAAARAAADMNFDRAADNIRDAAFALKPQAVKV